VHHCALWGPWPGAEEGRYTVGGAVVLAPPAPEHMSLVIEHAEGARPAFWGLPSEHMTGLYPDNPRARRACFEAHGVPLRGDAPARAVLVGADGRRSVLGEYFVRKLP
jgi:hypothetical protein